MRSGPSPALARLPLAEALDELGDELTLGGQALRDRAGFRLESRGQGLWVANWQSLGDEPAVEAELRLDGRRVRDYHCECAAFAKTSRCPHLAAALAGVELRKQVRASRRATAKKRRPQTASVKRLLQSVADVDLRDFVVDYARKRPDFALDLRLRFAESLPVANRFEQVIKNLLKRSGATYGPSQARRISDALDQFAEQRERYLAERAFLDLFELNTTLAPRLIVLADKAARIRADLPAYVQACIRELALAARRSPPPVLLERLERWLGAQVERGAYFRNGAGAGLADLADALARDDGARALDLLTDAAARYGDSRELAAARMEVLYRHGREAEAQAVLLGHLGDVELVTAALAEEVAAGRLARAVRLAEAAYSHLAAPAERLRLARFLCSSAPAAGRPELLQTYLPGVVVADGSLDALTAACSAEGVDDAAVDRAAELTLAAVETSGLRAELRDLLRARLLRRLRRPRDLEDLLYRTTYPTVVAEALPALTGGLPDEDLALLLDTKVREHLADRFGATPAAWTAGLLDEVARRSRTDVVGPVAAALRRDFRQRPALLEALDAVAL